MESHLLPDRVGFFDRCGPPRGPRGLGEHQQVQRLALLADVDARELQGP
jgi:hypothetical protein